MRTETRRILVNSSLSMSFRAHCIAGAGTELLRRARTELHPCLHPEASARSAATSRLELAALLRAVRDLRLGGRPRDARSTPVLAGLAVGTGATKKDGVRAKRRLQGRTRRSRRANASCKDTAVPSTSARIDPLRLRVPEPMSGGREGGRGQAFPSSRARGAWYKATKTAEGAQEGQSPRV